MTTAGPPAPPHGPGVQPPVPSPDGPGGQPLFAAPPPPGPGVQPPFPAPPVEGKGRRIGLGLGIGAVVLLLVCGGGIAALIGLTASFSGALNEQAHKVVAAYLDALHDRSYDKAYGMLCRQAKDDESAEQFRDRVSAEPAIASYQLGKFDMARLEVPVDARYTDGTSAQLKAELDQNSNTGAFEVCSLAR